MSKSTPIRKHGNRSTSLIVSVLFLSACISACDGGLFGTGDGSDVVDTTDAAGPADINTPDITMPGADNPDMGTENTNGSPIAPDTEPTPQPQSFSNTTPSGIETSATALPALKLINLTSLALNAASDFELSGGNTVDALPGQTSDFLRLNVGESVVNISVANNITPTVSISPLNAAQDSITTIIATASISSDADNTGDDTVSRIDIRAVDTRARVSAPEMAEVRLVLAAMVGEASNTQFRLTPDESNTTGTELVLSSSPEIDSAVVSYSLANAGNYRLTDSDGVISSQSVVLEAEKVYSIIITGNPESPVYIEVDSSLP